jgi:3-isopropylmalate dehydratase small subunit
MEVSAAEGERFPFALDPFRRECLLKGLDEIGLTLSREAEIGEYEGRSPMLGWTVPRPSGERRLGLRFGGPARA